LVFDWIAKCSTWADSSEGPAEMAVAQPVTTSLPSTLGIDPLRQRLPENEEQPISLIYAWVFVTDREEGLVMVSVGTLVDGDPNNNFLDKAKVIRFNPDGKLFDARHSFMAGTNLYVVAQQGLFVLGLRNDAEAPVLMGELTDGLRIPAPWACNSATASCRRRRFGRGSTRTTKPRLGRRVSFAQDAQRFYLARTYAYVANEPEGLAVINIENLSAQLVRV
jgi:hypothetical protein